MRRRALRRDRERREEGGRRSERERERREECMRKVRINWRRG